MPERRHFATLPPDTPIPVGMAGLVVGKGRSTIYAWIARGLLEPTETADGMMTTPAAVRKAEAGITRGRPAAERDRKAGQSEIGLPVD